MKSLAPCTSESGFHVRVAVGLTIIFITAAIGAAIGALVGAAMNDMGACAWGFAAGAGLGGIIMKTTVFRERP